MSIATAVVLSLLSQTVNIQVKDDGNQSNSTTSYADISDLTFEVGSNTTYLAQWVLVASSASGLVGIQLAVNGPASPTQMVATITCFTALGTPAVLNTSTYDSGLDLTTSAGTSLVQCTIRLTLINGANAGVVAPRLRSSSGGTAVTVYNGSSLVYNTP